MQVYELDQDNFYVGFAELKEENKDTLNYATVPMMIGYYKPRFNHDIQDWYEGATQEEIEEIKRQEEADKPPQEPNEMEVLKARVDGLENINAGLLLENAEHQIKIQKQEEMNKEQEVTNANLLLEIAILKGAIL